MNFSEEQALAYKITGELIDEYPTGISPQTYRVQLEKLYACAKDITEGVKQEVEQTLSRLLAIGQQRRKWSISV